MLSRHAQKQPLRTSIKVTGAALGLWRRSGLRIPPGKELDPIGMEGVRKDSAEPNSNLSRPIVAKDGRFDNPWSTWKESKPLDIFKWLLTDRKGSGWLEAKQKPSAADWAAAFPLQRTGLEAFQDPPAGAVQALWVGHATLLVQLGGVTFLTDPVFSDRASPLSFAGPKRFVQPPFDLEDPRLPKIDFVVISHNHYDHLDLSSVKLLLKRFGSALTWYVPLKLGKWFESVGIPKESIVEMDWWKEVQHPDSKVTVAFTPAQHWSNRGTDRRASLWGGFAVVTNSLRFFFAGDTGYCPAFAEIGSKYGPFDLAAIPIGAYEPRRIMKAQHVNPEEAIRIHKEVRSKRSVSIHCCTFCLTDEAMDEPPRLLIEEAAKAGLMSDEFVTLQHGGHITTAAGKDLHCSATL